MQFSAKSKFWDFLQTRNGQLSALFLTYALGLWWYGVPLTGDQKVYVNTSLEMFQTKHWLYPVLMGTHYYDKPPFQNWMTLVGWNLFGFGAFGTFFPSVAATLGSAWFVSKISALLYPTAKPSLAGIIFATTAGSITYACSAQMEAWVVFFYSGAWYGGLKYLNDKKPGTLFLAFIFAGLSATVKSPLYSVFWVLAFMLLVVLRKEWRVFRDRFFYLALVTGIGVGVAWFAVILATDFNSFWSDYVVRETLNKRFGNGGGLLHMYADFFISLFPWALLLPFALWKFVSSTSRRDPRLGFLLSWCLLPSLFFSFFPYRTETYLYILTPAFAMALAWGLEIWGPEAKLWLRANAALLLTAALLLAALFFRSGMLPLAVAGGLPLAAAVLFTFAWSGNHRAMVFASLLIVLAFRLSAIELGQADVRDLRVAVARHPDREISFYDGGHSWWNEIGLLSVAIGKPGFREPDTFHLAQSLGRGNLLVLSVGEWREQSAALENQAKIAGKSLRVDSWWRWNRGFEMPSRGHVFRMADPTSPGWREQFMREYKICYLD